MSISNSKIPEPALRRLPWYLSYVKLLKGRGETYVSSTRIADKIDVSATQIAKDLSYVNISGKTRVGYDIDELIHVLESFLGFTKQHKAVVFGVGSLGAALLSDSGLEQFGLKIIAGFDVDDSVVNESTHTIPVYHSNEFIERNKGIKAEIGILAVPSGVAQTVSNYMVRGGIKAIWNFTPFRVRVSEDVVLQNTSLYAHLAVMFNRLNDSKIQKFKNSK
ncbi:MAG: redox-sensing transcriptional repressor Rex [Dysgonamonadaceae bacterium]|jgi:redox-sensing transcriptional repressor|nr:redox-sensing transcriptional repressor Rex [Dysgonamonadaceae bacterium]